jgi:hypothetical protein
MIRPELDAKDIVCYVKGVIDTHNGLNENQVYVIPISGEYVYYVYNKATRARLTPDYRINAPKFVFRVGD